MNIKKGATTLTTFILALVLSLPYIASQEKIKNYSYKRIANSIAYNISKNLPITYGKVNNVPLYTQTKNLSCESTAIKMVLKYYGIEAEEDQIQSKFKKNLNPNLGFRGDVDGDIWGFDDYGVYAGPVSKVVQSFGLNTQVYTGISQEALKQQILVGKTAIIWVNIANPNPEEKVVKVGNQDVKLISGEHTVVVAGYRNGFWYLNDPWRRTSKDGEKIAEQLVVRDLNDIMWNSFDNMTVIIEKDTDEKLITSKTF